MQRIHFALPLAAMLPLPGMAAGKQPSANTDPRPNIIFFLVDDMGWQDT